MKCICIVGMEGSTMARLLAWLHTARGQWLVLSNVCRGARAWARLALG